MSIPFHVTVLAADHEQDEILRVAGVRNAPGGRRLDVDQPTLADLARLCADLDERSSTVDEVELVLTFVEVQETLEARRHHDPVDAEGRDAEFAPNLAKAVPVAEIVEGAERVTAHSFRTIPSASSRVNARSVSVCSAPYRFSFIRISIATSSSGASKISTTS